MARSIVPALALYRKRKLLRIEVIVKGHCTKRAARQTLWMDARFDLERLHPELIGSRTLEKLLTEFETYGYKIVPISLSIFPA